MGFTSNMDLQTPYWDSRAEHQFRYKSETFYTITPVPLYFYRRSCLLKLLVPMIEPPEMKRICDFGCGDGWYLHYLDHRLPGKDWTGVDISQIMLDQALTRSPSAKFLLINEELTGVEFDKPFDLIYAIAVFAHILNDAKATSLFQQLADNLTDGGRLVIFEQTGSQRVRRSTFCRRLSIDYRSFGTQCGLTVELSHLIVFPAHVIFERKFAPIFYRYYAKSGADDFLCRLKANQNILFRFLSRLAVALSPRHIWPDDGKLWGNSFIVFHKPEKSASHINTPHVLNEE